MLRLVLYVEVEVEAGRLMNVEIMELQTRRTRDATRLVTRVCHVKISS